MKYPENDQLFGQRIGDPKKSANKRSRISDEKQIGDLKNALNEMGHLNKILNKQIREDNLESKYFCHQNTIYLLVL